MLSRDQTKKSFNNNQQIHTHKHHTLVFDETRRKTSKYQSVAEFYSIIAADNTRNRAIAPKHGRDKREQLIESRNLLRESFCHQKRTSESAAAQKISYTNRVFLSLPLPFSMYDRARRGRRAAVSFDCRRGMNIGDGRNLIITRRSVNIVLARDSNCRSSRGARNSSGKQWKTSTRQVRLG